MSNSPSLRHWLWTCGLFAAAACQDRPLNLLPDSLQVAATGGSPELNAGAGGSLPSAGSNSAGQPTGGGGAGAGDSAGGSISGGGSTSGDGQGGSARANAGAGGSVTCQSDADCAPPTPGCSPTAHVCKQCSKSSQCPNGQICSVDDGQCDN